MWPESSVELSIYVYGMDEARPGIVARVSYVQSIDMFVLSLMLHLCYIFMLYSLIIYNVFLVF